VTDIINAPITLGAAIASITNSRSTPELIADALRLPIGIVRAAMTDPHMAAQPLEDFRQKPGDTGDLDPDLVRYVNWKFDQLRAVLTVRGDTAAQIVDAAVGRFDDRIDDVVERLELLSARLERVEAAPSVCTDT
jgi:hypothetical protein